jgi:energy-coupling factor transporter ATP-binding protein EcfA2
MTSSGGQVQAQEVRFELQSLGWKAFQDLCGTVLSEVLGQTFQVFSSTRDAGRDGAFKGDWQPRDGNTWTGSFVAQCKFTSRRDSGLRKSDLADEFAKVARLVKQGLCDNYLLLTNLNVTGESDIAICDELIRLGVKNSSIFGAEWISLKIRESSRLRMLVPRVYGLGDLSQILDERAYVQARALLESMSDDLSKFVITDAYRSSAEALYKHGFVLLLGEPGSGKSTIAGALALAAADLWKCLTLRVDNADQFERHWNPNEPRQFFWVDDAFGTTQYQHHLAESWNRRFAMLRAAVQRKVRVLLTSRDYVYRAALRNLKLTEFPLLSESQVIINVQDLTAAEKRQILYNHIKLGNQPREFRRTIKPYLEGIADSSAFLPETARRLGDQRFTTNLQLTPKAIERFVTNPADYLNEVIATLGVHEKAGLALVFMTGGSLPSPIRLTSDMKAALDTMGSTKGSAIGALGAMNDSFVKLVRVASRQRWTFKHPTIRDAFAATVAHEPELLNIYLQGTPIDKLVEEVTCGDVRLEGAKVVVPSSNYEQVYGRLTQFARSGDHFRSRFLEFLSTRCDAAFLRQFVVADRDLLNSISVARSYLSMRPEVQLVARLHQFGLLPQECRSRFVAGVGDLAVHTPDADFLADVDIRNLFSEAELATVISRVRQELVPSLSSVVNDWAAECDVSDASEVEDHFSLLNDALVTYRSEFDSEPAIAAEFDEALSKIEDEIEEIVRELPREPDDDDDYEFAGRSETSSGDSNERSVFDDVDD